jgi:hypothetical protein
VDLLPGNAVGIPAEFNHHPFWFIDFKAKVQISKQAAQCSTIWTTKYKCRFYMDFGFMQALVSDLSWADRSKDHVIYSYGGFFPCLLVDDEASRYIRIILTLSKEPPLAITSEFLWHTHTTIVAAYKSTKEVSLLRATNSKIWFYATTTTCWSLPDLAAPPKTKHLKSTMTNLTSKCAHSSIALVYQ